MDIDVYLIWFLIGIAFFIFEMSVPTFILFFFGIGAWIVSITLGLLYPSLSFNQQLILFCSSSIISLLSLRNYVKMVFLGEQKMRDFGGLDPTTEETQPEGKSGNIAVVTKAIEANGFGQIKFKGTFYKSTSEVSINEGENVEVVDKGNAHVGSYYVVKKIN